MTGRELPEWCDIGPIKIRSGKLTAIDFGVMNPVDGISEDVAVGEYAVQAKIMSFDGNLGISRARVLPLESAEPARLETVKTISVDFAQIAIGDIADAATNLTREDRKAISNAVRPYRKTQGAIATLHLPSKVITLACISSGFGDGKYPISRLMLDGKVVGFEIEFVKDGYVYSRTPSTVTKADLLEKLKKLSALQPPKS
jgi:hypothetical protein